MDMRRNADRYPQGFQSKGRMPVLPFFVAKHCLEVCKRRMRGYFAAIAVGPIRRFQLALMLVVMTVKTEQLPIAAVCRIIVVVVIAVMDGQFAEIGAGEFACTAPADPCGKLERLFAVTLLPGIGCTPGFLDDAVKLSYIAGFHHMLLLARRAAG